MAKHGALLKIDAGALVAIKAAIQQKAQLAARHAIYTVLIGRLEEHAEDDTGERVREQVMDRDGVTVSDQAVDTVLTELYQHRKELEDALRAFE